MTTWKLKRTKQCAKCPWKVSTNPHEIPDGYSEKAHCDLKRTIATDTSIKMGGMHVMACHHSIPEDEEHCIGWLHNQLGVGNNIGMRLRMMTCENAKDIKIYGDQHTKFEDTLPENK